MDNLVITIGREFGSAGKDIGIGVAKRLGVRCYDKELLEEAAKDSEFCEEIFENHDEKPTSSFLYSLVMDSHSYGGYSSPSFLDMPLNQKIFLAQFETIKKIAEKESCVMVGRCADYALQEFDNCVSVFVHAELPFKIQHLKETFQVDDNTAKELMKKTDKKRASYYNYYTSKRWGDSSSYDLCLNCSDLGIKGCVDLIMDYIDIKKKQNK
ncbi:MAG: cytidylate kinase-like family protein [Lachnospiraceae bacterium]